MSSDRKICKIDGTRFAVRGSDFCNVHGGRLPQISVQAEKAVERFCKYDWNPKHPDEELCPAHLASGDAILYTGHMQALKTPAQWEAEEGRYIPNRSIYEKVGLETPITYEMWHGITINLTSMWNGVSAPKTISKSLAIEKLETKIEEVREGIEPAVLKGCCTDEEWEDYRFGQGHLSGLEAALDIIKAM